jgi:hypothetical protein
VKPSQVKMTGQKIPIYCSRGLWGFFAFLIYFKLKYLYYFILFYKMSLNIDNQNIEDEEDKNILTITEFKKKMKSLMDDCTNVSTKILKIQNNIILFDYLVETQNFWKKGIKSMDLAAKNKLLEYKDMGENNTFFQSFPADKYLKLLGFRCSYETRSGKLCKNHPVNGICAFHKKFDEVLQVTVTENAPLIKVLQDIVINYIR